MIKIKGELDVSMAQGWYCPSCGVGNNPRQAFCVYCVRCLTIEKIQEARKQAESELEIPDGCILFGGDPAEEEIH